jgi:lipid-A-disaccharide synthase
LRYFFSTGEASGERAAVLLAKAIAAKDGDAQFEGIGAGAMRAARFTIWRDHTGWASMGPLAAIPRIPKLLLQMWLTAIHLARDRPNLIVLVDFGVFNLRLAKTLRDRLHYTGPILYLYPPGAWLDSERTARAVCAAADAVTAFEHQAQFYRSLGLPIQYFGHPVATKLALRERRPAPPRDGGCVAFLPGSRSGEIRFHLPIMLQTFGLLRERRPRLSAVVAALDESLARQLRSAIERSGESRVAVVVGVSAALESADAAVVASGTAVLESVLSGVPTIALYVVSRTVVWYGRRMQRRIYRGGRYITLPNLIAGDPIVPEFLQEDASPQRLAEAIDATLCEPDRQRAAVERLLAALGPADALERIADAAIAAAKRTV